jgi:photosystem II stability/assembly factor-like uncharacterized protein
MLGIMACLPLIGIAYTFSWFDARDAGRPPVIRLVEVGVSASLPGAADASGPRRLFGLPVEEIRGRDTALLRVPDGVAVADMLRSLASKRDVRHVAPAGPRLRHWDTHSRTTMRATIDAWTAAWREYYALTSGGDLTAARNRKVPKLGYLEAYLEWFDSRAYPDDDINWAIYGRGRVEQNGMLAAPDVGVNQWVYLGPTNVDTPFRNGMGLPPVNGRVNALAYDPQSPSTIYAASACGGVWKTTNAGASWFPLSDDWEELYTSAIAVNPLDPSTIYVGTGDFPGARGTGIKLMVSSDGGATWEDQGAGLPSGKRISDILVDPDSRSRITVTTGRSPGSDYVYQSTDGGGTWSVVLNTSADWCDLAVGAPTAGGLRYYYAAGVSDSANHVWRSADRGETWEQLTLPALVPQQALGIDASRLNPTVLYMLAPDTRRVYQGTNAGDDWTDITGDLDQNNDHWGQGHYSFRVNCNVRISGDGNPSDGVFVACNDVMYGNAAGDWETLGGPAYSDNGLIHVDTHGFANHPTDLLVTLVSNDGGVYRYDGSDFTRLSGRLGCMLPNRLDVHPTQHFFLLGGTQDNGTSLCTGNLDQWYTIVAGDTGHVAINPKYPQFQYAAPASQLGRDGNDDVYIWRTSNYWQVNSGSKLYTNVGSDSMRHGTPIAVDPINTNRLYFASDYLYRYDENTQTWATRLGGQKLSTGSHVYTMAIAPSNGNRIYTGSRDREIWMTTDAGLTWERIDDMVTPDATVSGISVDPINPSRILVCYSSSSDEFVKVWECKNTLANPRVWGTPTGINIGEKLPNVPVNALARHPIAGSSYWYAATDIGVFGTANQGKKWFDMTQPLGLPQVEVTDLRVNKLHYLYASTYGRGFWRIKAAPVAPTGLKAPADP